jgi:phosphoglycolate phosphatase
VRALPYKLIIFDFDGTLADTFPWIMQMADRVIARFRLRPISPADYDRLRRGGARELMKELKLPFWKLPKVARYIQDAMRAETDSLSVFPGVEEMIARLAERGFKLAMISSNSPENVRAVLGPELCGRMAHFDCGASLFGKDRKFKRALRATGVTAAETLCIGDELRDLEAARKVGIAFGAVSWGYTAAEALAAQKPAFVFKQVSEIAEALGA